MNKMLLTNNSRRLAGLPTHRGGQKRNKVTETVDAFLDYCEAPENKAPHNITGVAPIKRIISIMRRYPQNQIMVELEPNERKLYYTVIPINENFQKFRDYEKYLIFARSYTEWPCKQEQVRSMVLYKERFFEI